MCVYLFIYLYAALLYNYVTPFITPREEVREKRSSVMNGTDLQAVNRAAVVNRGLDRSRSCC